MILTPEECGKAVLALCSGLLDAVNGQIISVDYGLPFRDNAMGRYLVGAGLRPTVRIRPTARITRRSA